MADAHTTSMMDGIQDGGCGGDQHMFTQPLGTIRAVGVGLLNDQGFHGGISPIVGIR